MHLESTVQYTQVAEIAYEAPRPTCIPFGCFEESIENARIRYIQVHTGEIGVEVERRKIKCYVSHLSTFLSHRSH